MECNMKEYYVDHPGYEKRRICRNNVLIVNNCNKCNNCLIHLLGRLQVLMSFLIYHNQNNNC